MLAGAALVASALGHFPAVVAGQTKPAGPAPAPRLVTLTAGDPVGDKMEYSRSTITAKPGERLRVRLISLGKLPATVMTHNWVLLKLGSDPKRFSDAAAMAVSTGYIPAALKGEILAQTGMVGPGDKQEVVFTAPAKPGSYPYLCTFAGHWAAGMKGTLVVK
jgi:azurin